MVHTVYCDDHDDITARHEAEGRVIVSLVDTESTVAKSMTSESDDVVTKPATKPANKKA